ncbi:Heteroproteinous nuclear ribonucleoprotein Q [Turnera subulata]|uniref:Heteroproteinous nuclear ribonucleoprotein Q n=1 Tax=Turnera subulata TaxID=218843 RepID=A0A9Q0J2K8_9ROSI|nr:Heteroproteinous nuclear ribonucleoprotein Q [Turnera subulata]
MAEGTEVEDRVDLEEDNYMEEMDDDVEDQLDEDGEDDAAEPHEEENGDEDSEDSKVESGQKDQSPEADRSHVNSETAEEEQKPTVSVNEEDKEKHAHLLSLPPHGAEVFIGGLPKDAVEDDLRDLCEPLGDIYEIRLMKDKDSKESKGFAFVAFKSKEVAQKAIDELHGKEFKGKTLRCSVSETKNRLFIGNVPKSWTEEEFRKVVEEVGPGVDIIELIKLFISSYIFVLAIQVKALYVKNIPENTSTDQLKELFLRHGEVTKVVMPPGKTGKRDFGFVHYAERSSALKAVKDTEKYEIDGHVLEVVLAKPQNDKKGDGAYSYNAGMPPNPVPHPAYGGGFTGNAYGGGSLGAGFGVPASFQQPVIYGRGPMPAGMHMVPMVLPDGRIGYVLQQPGMQMSQPRPRRGDRSNGPGGPGRAGSSGDDGNRGRRYRPY